MKYQKSPTGTVYQDFRPGKKTLAGPAMKRQKRFREMFVFAKRYSRKTCVRVIVESTDENDYADIDGKILQASHWL